MHDITIAKHVQAGVVDHESSVVRGPKCIRKYVREPMHLTVKGQVLYPLNYAVYICIAFSSLVVTVQVAI